MEAIKVGLADFPAFVAGEKGAPAVIVVQEWWGVTDVIKEHALRISQSGYRVLIPDIYKGNIGVNAEEAHHLMTNLDFDAAIVEIEQAAAYLKAEGSANVGIVGFCMGASLLFGALSKCADIKCGAPFYGFREQFFDAAALKDKPIEGHFGALDTMEGFSDPETGKKIEADLKAAGSEHATVYIYDDVGHAFLNTSPSPFESFEDRKEKSGMPPYNKQVAEVAWGRLIAFFDKWLK